MTEYSVNQDGSCHICSVIVEMTDYICSLSHGFWVLISKGPDAEKMPSIGYTVIKFVIIT
jgi:hypothetical protein